MRRESVGRLPIVQGTFPVTIRIRSLLIGERGLTLSASVQVIMATNRADTLDPALLRPGRLDRKIEFPTPDRRSKRLIFQARPSVGTQRTIKREFETQMGWISNIFFTAAVGCGRTQTPWMLRVWFPEHSIRRGVKSLRCARRR